jgi:hypothetical protein
VCNQRLSELEKLFILTTRGCPSSLDSFHRVGYFPLSHSHAFFPCRASATLGRRGHRTRPPGVVITPPFYVRYSIMSAIETKSPGAELGTQDITTINVDSLESNCSVARGISSISCANCLSPSMSVVNYVLKSGCLPHGSDNGAKDAVTSDLLK